MSNEVDQADHDLVALAQHGDRKAFGTLAQRHQTAVYRVCFRILYDAEDAADAMQETWVRAYTKMHTFQKHSAFKTWLMRIAVNVSLNHRSRQRDGVALDDVVLHAPDDIEDLVVRAEAVQQLHRALQLLPSNHRAAVVLRDLEGWSYHEVARSLDVLEGTARTWAHRGRERLKELLT